jgi:UDP-N-acetylglucosamine--dolichyl-phosphate N-acetylglucosaminephosphotransferase
MSLVSIFAPNSINILAGINGLEVSQSVAIACLILLNDLFYLPPKLLLSLLTSNSHLISFGVDVGSAPVELTPAQSAHLSSIYLLLPFLAVSLALLLHNWYPAKVFVGDTYCYFAGMVFAVVAIQGHFSKTLLLLMVPQIVNFVYSMPQLFHLVPIPRHRLPHFVEIAGTGEGVLEASWVEFGVPKDKLGSGANGMSGKGNGTVSAATRSKTSTSASTNGTTTAATLALTTPGLPKFRPTSPPRRPKAPIQLALKLLHKFKLIDMQVDSTTGEVLRCTNMTLINLWLVWRGPLREDRLCAELTALQVVVGLAGLWVRHRLALWVFPIDNL